MILTVTLFTADKTNDKQGVLFIIYYSINKLDENTISILRFTNSLLFIIEIILLHVYILYKHLYFIHANIKIVQHFLLSKWEKTLLHASFKVHSNVVV